MDLALCRMYGDCHPLFAFRTATVTAQNTGRPVYEFRAALVPFAYLVLFCFVLSGAHGSTPVAL